MERSFHLKNDNNCNVTKGADVNIKKRMELTGSSIMVNLIDGACKEINVGQ